eukprot:SAG31_NODE_3001_length_4799_cov_3.189362_2_plen_1003_part_00
MAKGGASSARANAPIPQAPAGRPPPQALRRRPVSKPSGKDVEMPVKATLLTTVSTTAAKRTYRAGSRRKDASAGTRQFNTAINDSRILHSPAKQELVALARERVVERKAQEALARKQIEEALAAKRQQAIDRAAKQREKALRDVRAREKEIERDREEAAAARERLQPFRKPPPRKKNKLQTLALDDGESALLDTTKLTIVEDGPPRSAVSVVPPSTANSTEPPSTANSMVPPSTANSMGPPATANSMVPRSSASVPPVTALTNVRSLGSTTQSFLTISSTAQSRLFTARKKLVLTKEHKQSKTVENFGRVLRNALNGKRQLYGVKLDCVAALFNACDEDNSGTMDVDEFDKAMKRLGLGLSQSQMNELVSVFDEDGNGQIEVSELTSSIDGTLAKKLWGLGDEAYKREQRGEIIARIMADSEPGQHELTSQWQSDAMMEPAERIRKSTVIHRFRQQLGLLVKARQRHDVETRGVRGPRKSVLTANPDVPANATPEEELLGHMSWLLREAKTQDEIDDAENFGIAALEMKAAVATAEQFAFALPTDPLKTACSGLYRSCSTFLGVHATAQFAKYIATILSKNKVELAEDDDTFVDNEIFDAHEKFLVIEAIHHLQQASAPEAITLADENAQHLLAILDGQKIGTLYRATSLAKLSGDKQLEMRQLQQQRDLEARIGAGIKRRERMRSFAEARSQEGLDLKLAKKAQLEQAWAEEDERRKREKMERSAAEAGESMNVQMQLDIDFNSLPVSFKDDFRQQLAEALGINKNDLLIGDIEPVVPIPREPVRKMQEDNPFEGWRREEVHYFTDAADGRIDVFYHTPPSFPNTEPLVGMLDVQKMHVEGEMVQVSSMSTAEFVDAFWFDRWEKFTEQEKADRRQIRMVEFYIQNEYAGKIQAFVRGQRDRARVALLRKEKGLKNARRAQMRQAAQMASQTAPKMAKSVLKATKATNVTKAAQKVPTSGSKVAMRDTVYGAAANAAPAVNVAERKKKALLAASLIGVGAK